MSLTEKIFNKIGGALDSIGQVIVGRSDPVAITLQAYLDLAKLEIKRMAEEGDQGGINGYLRSLLDQREVYFDIEGGLSPEASFFNSEVLALVMNYGSEGLKRNLS